MNRLLLKTPSVVRAVAIAASGALLIAGCSANSPAPPSQPEAAQQPTASSSAVATETPGDFDLAVFCEAAAPLTVVVPREFVGTPEHVALFDDLRAASTPEIAQLVTTLRDHYEFDVDVADPESQNFSNFPPEIQRVALDLQSYIDAHCARE